MSEHPSNPVHQSGAWVTGVEEAAALVETVDHLQRELAAARDKIANLERALASNRRIGLAIGILMCRHKISGEAAFELLRAASNSSSRKLHDIAEDVIEVGELNIPHGRHRLPATPAEAAVGSE